MAQLKIDSRFVNSPLPHNHQVRLFHEHVAHLRSKHLAALHSFFEEKSPTLDSQFTSLPVDELVTSSAATRLGYSINQFEDEFNRWQRQRRADARLAFDEMLNENSFVEFWGRLSKMNDVKLDQGLQIGHEDLIGEEDESANKIDMKALAKTVDIDEMVKVLRRDKRYIMFDHVPEEREKWLRVRVRRLLLMSFPSFLISRTISRICRHPSCLYMSREKFHLLYVSITIRCGPLLSVFQCIYPRRPDDVLHYNVVFLTNLCVNGLGLGIGCQKAVDWDTKMVHHDHAVRARSLSLRETRN